MQSQLELGIAPVFWQDAAPVAREEESAVPSEQPTEAAEQPEPAPVWQFLCGA